MDVTKRRKNRRKNDTHKSKTAVPAKIKKRNTLSVWICGSFIGNTDGVLWSLICFLYIATLVIVEV